MLSIMLVDDEPLVKIAFRSLIDLSGHNFALTSEAANGEEALQLFREAPVDIVITDIKMPVMDGLELVRRLKELQNNVICIVLSSYSDFQFAKSALQLGVFDYILKPEMSFESILEVLKRAESVILSQKNDHLNTGGPTPTSLQTIQNMTDIFLKKLIWGEIQDEEAIRSRIRELDLRLQPANLLVALVYVEPSRVQEAVVAENLGNLAFSIANTINLISNEYALGNTCMLSSQEHAVVISFAPEAAGQFRESLHTYFLRLYQSLMQYMNVTISMGASSLSQAGFSQVPGLYSQARAALSLRFGLGRGKLFFYDDVCRKPGVCQQLDLQDPLPYLQKFLQFPDRIAMDYLLSRLLVNGTLLALAEYEKVILLYTEYFKVISDFTTRSSLSYLIKSELAAFSHLLKHDGTLVELNDTLTRMLTAYKDDFNKYDSTVRRARQYVDDHYAKPLTLAEIANVLQVSEGHLSRLFSEQMGINFAHYLTNVRIEKAKELMMTRNLKVYEIAEAVGYSFTESFSRAFKEVTGNSPKDFLKRH